VLVVQELDLEPEVHLVRIHGRELRERVLQQVAPRHLQVQVPFAPRGLKFLQAVQKPKVLLPER